VRVAYFRVSISHISSPEQATPPTAVTAKATAIVRGYSLIVVGTVNDPDITVLVVIIVGVLPGAAAPVLPAPPAAPVVGKLSNVAPSTWQYPL
jgi:hypothetical protein